jgi:hypothetical protein
LTDVKAAQPPAPYTRQIMNADFLPMPSFAPSRFIALVRPKEHGSWSLALEPIALGLIAAPSLGGGWFAVAVLGAFFARRPLRIRLHDQDQERRSTARSALGICALVSGLAMALAVFFSGAAWIVWIVPSAIAGGVFLWFDLRNAGRAELAEAAGATAFACLPAVFAAMAGWGGPAAAALAILMLARAVPAVLGVRACLRAKKTGEWHVIAALAATGVTVAAVMGFWTRGELPAVTFLLVVLLGLRTVALLIYPRIALRARTLGMIEAVLGALFVVTAGVAFA